MITSSTSGWLTPLADLSLILFMLTAAALARAEAAAIPAGMPVDGEAGDIVSAEAVAVYRPSPGAPELASWLTAQPFDPAQRLTILLRHKGALSGRELETILPMAREAHGAGFPPRIVIETGQQASLAAKLAYDSDPSEVARKLRQQLQTQPNQPSRDNAR